MVAALAGCLLAGCSPAFAGFPLGGREEIVFVCEEGSGMAQEDAGMAGTDGEGSPEETAVKSASVEKPAEEAKKSVPGEKRTEKADASGENLTEGEAVAASQTADASEAAPDGRVNLNEAGLEELMTLSGIGETRARAIIDYRSTQGAFTCIEDIMKISGIKEGIFEKIKDQIKVQ